MGYFLPLCSGPIKSLVSGAYSRADPVARDLKIRYSTLSVFRRAILILFTSLFALWFLVTTASSSSSAAAATAAARHSASGKFEKYHCFGPGVAPFDLDPNTFSEWHRKSPTPVIFHQSEIDNINNNNDNKLSNKNLDNEDDNKLPTNSSSSSEDEDENETTKTNILITDLNKIKSSPEASENKENVLILTPLKDAAVYLPKYFELLESLTYPHHLIDIAFLISDTSDETLSVLALQLERVQKGKSPFRRASVFTKDFINNSNRLVHHGENYVDKDEALLNLDNLNVEERHAFAAQAPRRKAMARARNYLLSAALRSEHSWVMWRDADIVESPRTIVEDLIKHDTDIIVPNIWFHRYRPDGTDIEGRFDYNSWKDTDKTRRLLENLDVETVLVEGYKEYDTGREYMALMGDWRWNKDEEVELDGCGGVNIMVKSDVHRTGINFPAYAFENQAETEGFAKMAKRAGYSVIGLPNYVVWHIDTEEKSKS